MTSVGKHRPDNRCTPGTTTGQKLLMYHCCATRRVVWDLLMKAYQNGQKVSLTAKRSFPDRSSLCIVPSATHSQAISVSKQIVRFRQRLISTISLDFESGRRKGGSC